MRASFEKLFKQYEQYGYWKVYVNKKHKAVTTVRQLIPLLFVLFLILGFFAAFLNILLCEIYLLGLVFYSLASLYSATKQASAPKQIVKIMKAFFILHFSYGLGYLKGIIDFFVLQKNIKKEEVLTR